MDTPQPQMRSSAEFDLIARIRERLASGGDGSTHPLGIGDDAAVTVPAGATATSIDALIDGVHFRSRWCSPKDAGHKALASALGDLAAMGAEPGEAYLWLGRPEGMSDADCLDLCDGAAGVCRRAGVSLLGGDLTRAPVLSLCAMVVGHAAEPGDLVARAGAEPGDVLCLTGELGAAGAGLLLLDHPELGEELEVDLAEALRLRQLRPEPRLAAGRALAEAGARAMIDVSDGLGADAEQIASASGVAIEIELSRVPAAAGVGEVAAAAGLDHFDLLASSGEDYELLAALPRARLAGAKWALEQLGESLTEIGSVGAGAGVRLRLPGGRSVTARGHDHLAP